MLQSIRSICIDMYDRCVRLLVRSICTKEMKLSKFSREDIISLSLRDRLYLVVFYPIPMLVSGYVFLVGGGTCQSDRREISEDLKQKRSTNPPSSRKFDGLGISLGNMLQFAPPAPLSVPRLPVLHFL